MEELSLLDELLIWLGLKEAPIQKQQEETPKPETEKTPSRPEPKSEPTPPLLPHIPEGSPRKRTEGQYPV